MADEQEEGSSFGSEPQAGGNPAAMAITIGSASRSEADAFLRDQRALIADQRHHLKAQLLPALWEKWLGVFLRAATAIMGLAVAGCLAALVWDAAHSKGLIVESFSVPSEMAERGLGGQVIASRIIDKLTAMMARESSRAGQNYANNWGNDVKVEIPETGVSIGELRNVLRDWLGHDIRIRGEVSRSSQEITVTARAGGGDVGGSFTGPETDLDALIQKAAEHVYEATQPYRYANYLDRNYDPNGLEDRLARATAIYKRLIAGDNTVERAWALNGLGTIEFNFRYDSRKAEGYYSQAVASVPDFTIGYFALSQRNMIMGQEEEGFLSLREAVRLLDRDSVPDLNPRYAFPARLRAKGDAEALVGDFTGAMPLYTEGANLPDEFSVLARTTFTLNGARALIAQHDLRAMHEWLRATGATPPGGASAIGNVGGRLATSVVVQTAIAVETQDWNTVAGIEEQSRTQIAPTTDVSRRLPMQATYDQLRPLFALARAHLGNFAMAESLIALVPPDIDLGLRTRGMIAELKGQHARADWWFDHAEGRAPHIPFADTTWGQALLQRGQPDPAIEKFKLANQKGPHFADPLEGWGEALMAKNQSHLALAKFTEAEKFAPNWGRLHLKWGEALGYAGKKDEARKHFARAGALDLTPGEKVELAKVPQ